MKKTMKKNVKKPAWWDEFLAFAVKGNAMALAVGTIIGGAFSTITKSLTNDLIMPVVNIFLGGADFSDIKIALPRMPWVEPTYELVVNEAGEEVSQIVQNYLTVGNFISAVINFLILAVVVFFIVKGLNALAEMKTGRCSVVHIWKTAVLRNRNPFVNEMHVPQKRSWTLPIRFWKRSVNR